MARIVDGFKPGDWTIVQSGRKDGCIANAEIDCVKGGYCDRRLRGALPRKRPRSRTRVRRMFAVENAAKEYVWLWERQRGVATNVIANREGVSVSRVRFGVARARAQGKSELRENTLRPPFLIPLFPVGPYTPQSSCGHRQPIRRGSILCCMVCHCSGMDEHPALQRDLGTEPVRETVPSVEQILRETRRQRRQRLFGSRA